MVVINDEITVLKGELVTLNNNIKSKDEAITANAVRIDEVIGWRGRVDTTVSNNLTKITALEARIIVLEARIDRTSSSGGDIDELVDIDVRVLDEGFPTGIDKTAIISLKVTVTNESTQDLEDLIVSIVLYVEDTNSVVSFVLEESGDERWYIRTQQSRAVEIRNTRADIDAGEDWRTYFDITIVFLEEEPDGSVDIEVDVLDYD